MRAVWKFSLGTGAVDTVDLVMPEGAEVLAVRTQYEMPCVWVLVDTERPDDTRTFRIVGTGHELPWPAEYLGTYELFGGGFIGHVFEVEK